MSSRTTRYAMALAVSTALAAIPAAAQATGVNLDVRDTDGSSTWFRVTIRDLASEQVHPRAGTRQPPDFAFQPQVYRSTGAFESLPPGDYDVELSRGPEYVTVTDRLKVPAAGVATLSQTLQRWVDPQARGYYSGDNHLHGSGCSFTPTLPGGVGPTDLLPHVLGENLNVAQILVWNPNFLSQRNYFSPDPWLGSRPDHVIKYDVEVSGFGSHQQGHYNLLGLEDIVYPGSVGRNGWPTWCKPLLEWARSQGAVTATAHSGFGLETSKSYAPHYEVPPMNGIGAMEFFVDAAFGLVDVMATVNSPLIPELNAWYNVQNVGLRPKIAGETDFPCWGKERFGRGRSYTKVDVPTGQSLDYDAWLEELRNGRGYVTDGGSHLFDFRVGGVGVGESGSELHLAQPGTVAVSATVAAYLPVTPAPFNKTWVGWNIERARVGAREVDVEVIVNGIPVRTHRITADGTPVQIDDTLTINRSSWVALRILNSSHTNSIYVLVGGQPIRASLDAALWCASVTDQSWAQNSGAIAAAERPAARQAYQAAKAAYLSWAGSAALGPYATARTYGTGCAGTAGTPAIDAVGDPVIGRTGFTITLAGAPAAVTPVLLLSTTPAATPAFGCTLLVGAAVQLVPAPATDPTGATAVSASIPASPGLEFAEVFAQWLVPDPTAVSGRPWIVSDGLRMHLSVIAQRP